MICTGALVLVKVCCLYCGKPANHLEKDSAFYVISCQDQDCPYANVRVMVEKSTHTVVSCDAYFMYTDTGIERIYPQFVRKDGSPAWKPNKDSVDEKAQLK